MDIWSHNESKYIELQVIYYFEESMLNLSIKNVVVQSCSPNIESWDQRFLKIVEEMIEKTMGFNSFEIFLFTL